MKLNQSDDSIGLAPASERAMMEEAKMQRDNIPDSTSVKKDSNEGKKTEETDVDADNEESIEKDEEDEDEEEDENEDEEEGEDEDEDDEEDDDEDV